jgi:hypothetical protein
MPARRLMASVAALLILASGGRGGGADPAPPAGRAGHQSRLDRLAALHSVSPASRQALEAMQAAKATRGARAASDAAISPAAAEPVHTALPNAFSAAECSSPVRYLPKMFDANVTWADTIAKINVEHQQQPRYMKFLPAKWAGPNGPDTLPTMVLHTTFYPSTLGDLFREVSRWLEAQGSDVIDSHDPDDGGMHVYVSLGPRALTLGAHRDTMHVLIVQQVGTMGYEVESYGRVELKAGDALVIPSGLLHEPFVHGPRITLSFGITTLLRDDALT